MPIKPDAPFPKTQGDNLRSKDWNDAINELIRLDNDKANRAGDKFSGPLSVSALGVGSDPPPSGIKVKGLTRIDESPTGAGAWANFGSNVYLSDDSWKQVDPSKAGVSLHINADGGGQEFRFLRIEANGGNLRNIATIGTNGLTLQAGNLSLGSANGSPSPTISTTGRMHITGAELCYLLHKDGVIVGKEWGGSGNLTVEGDMVGNGKLTVGGGVFLGNSDIYFTNTGHNHTGFGNTPGFAAIENGANYDALMILGRAGTDQGRKVKLWDYLEVNSGGGAIIKIGQWKGIKYTAGDGIRGQPNLWLDAAGKVFIKNGFGTDAMDIAERFQTSEAVEPGDVVVFDADSGAVKLCDEQGDSRVVGIASGQPGFILGLEEKEMPIALCGRVPCKVDADFAPVHAGDLLMTSPTKGHAQRVLDATKTAGKILGKALAPLLQGRGEIPVLVFLH